MIGVLGISDGEFCQGSASRTGDHKCVAGVKATQGRIILVGRERSGVPRSLSTSLGREAHSYR